MIQTHDLTRKFGERVAVDRINLEVAKGEIIGLLGPNGSGKTTTIRLLTGMIAPTSGSAVVAGKQVNTQAESLHENIGLLTETPGFYERLTAQRNLEYYAGFYPNLDVKRQVEKYLRLMGLWERRNDKAGSFSKGMKQRLALARALLHEPEVVFLDEPTSGLDPEAAGEVRRLIASLGKQGQTVFLSTHNLTEAEQLCHRIAVIRSRLLALDTPANLKSRLFRREMLVRLEAASPAVQTALSQLDFIRNLHVEGNQLRFELGKPEEEMSAAVKAIVDAGGKVLAVSEETHSLEDIYLNLVREEAPRGS